MNATAVGEEYWDKIWFGERKGKGKKKLSLLWSNKEEQPLGKEENRISGIDEGVEEDQPISRMKMSYFSLQLFVLY